MTLQRDSCKQALLGKDSCSCAEGIDPLVRQPLLQRQHCSVEQGKHWATQSDHRQGMRSL